MRRTTTPRLSTSRRRAAVLAAGLVLGALVPATSAHALTPPAPDGPGGFTLPPIDPGDPDPHPFPGAADDVVNPTQPEDPCQLLGIGCPVPIPGPGEPEPGGDGGPAAEPDPGDDTVLGRPDFTG